MTRRLGLAVVGVVDEAVAAAIAGQSPARVLEVAEAKVIEADQAANGLRTVVARVTAGDAHWVDATVDRDAEDLGMRPEHTGAGRDELPSIAFGWLARPAELLTLLVEAARDAETPQTAGEGAAREDAVSTRSLAPGAPTMDQARPTAEARPTRRAESSQEDQSEPEPEPEPTGPSRATAFPVDLLDALRGLDLSRLRPRATRYLHLHEHAVTCGSGWPGSRASGPRP